MKILIIEDNHDVAGVLGDYFEALGCELDYATNGEQGLKLALQTAFDAIILDLMLPKIDGLSLCRQLRQQACITPVLMLTALDSKQDLLQGFDVGADDYLGKPFDLEEVYARVKALVKRHKGQVAPNEISFSELSINLAQHKAMRAGQTLVLTPTTYQILVLLTQYAPNLVTREQVIEQLWGDNPPGQDILRSHIYQLRTQLDKPFATPMLVTVPKVGFKLQQT
ncbi:response regulator transcription factor [Shewanella maritima]|uniref:Response regulator transcription factor n=1 Tax=Shewanella maritima TaxID=2520507 RepID=A0A411PDQ9_9GAMM|nr:response regulator transcription factor [Shewanella maritima]QBF81510.1 response regulator transcription factor [Shewanella maritima]